jgi:uncharacterized delta-60 repeat protein
MFLSLTTYGQGWERVYSGGGQDEATDVALTPDGGYILTGYYNGNTNIALTKVNVDGLLEWTKFFPGTPRAAGNSIIVTRDSGYVIAGYLEGSIAGTRNSYLLKTNSNGDILWTKNFGVANNDEFNELVELSDGSLAITGCSGSSGTEDMRVVRTDASGNLLWSRQYGDLPNEEIGYGITLATNGDIVTAGYKKEQTSNKKDVYVVRIAPATGDVVWEQTYAMAPSVDDEARAITRTNDGHFVVAGFTQANIVSNGLILKINENGTNPFMWSQTYANVENLYDVATMPDGDLLATGFKDLPGSQGILTDLFIVRTNADGTTQWETNVGKAGPDIGNAVLPTADGGAVAVGYTQPDFILPSTYAYMARTDANGKFFTNYIQGRVFIDANNDCQPQLTEQGLKDWLVRVESPDFSRYVTADAFGRYSVMVDTGAYTLTVFIPNDSWESCTPPQTVNVPAFYDTMTANVGVVAAFACPRNQVDVQTPLLRRCASNTYTVRYCNNGPEASTNTYVDVVLGAKLSITASSVSYTTVGDTLRFQIGTLNSRQCGDFTFDAFLDCAAELNSTHCVRAHIKPDAFCAPSSNWDGSLIEARATCVDGRVKMYLKNKGLNPISDAIEYVVIQDVIMLTIPPNMVTTLPAGEEVEVWDELANNRTYRLIAEQTNGFPGASIPTAAIEGCKTDTTSAPMSTGFYTMFPEDDAEPAVASDCQEAYETNFNPLLLKRGHPKGYQALHYVEPTTPIEYLLYFQNNTSDTVRHVVLRDTLSQWLDPATVRLGTSSHPYDYDMYGTGVLAFTFDALSLAPGASGYVKFEVAQRPDLPCETRIENRAIVSYDFNAPVFTNQTFHTVCLRDSFVEVNTTYIPWEGADLKVYPNPFVSSAVFEVSGVTARTYTLEVFDAQGKLLLTRPFSDSRFQLFSHQLPNGQHFFRLNADGRLLATGRLMVHGY